MLQAPQTMSTKPGKSAYFLLLCSCSLIFAPGAHGQVQREVAPPAKSDTYAIADDGVKVRIQRRQIANSNFRISGVDLASDQDVLLQAAKALGKTTTELTGDASTSNDAACYQSASGSDQTHLIFGRGELDSSFTLTSNGTAWDAKRPCKKSAEITHDTATDSGLRLGLTKQQVLSILGLATAKRQNLRQHTKTLIYSLQGKGQTNPRKLARMWQEELRRTPFESHQDFLENYEFYTLEVYISARFVNDSLTRLYVSWSAQY